MGYVVVDEATGVKVTFPRTGKTMYETLAAARAARTRLVKMDMEAYLSGKKYPRTNYTIMDITTYTAQVPMVEVTNLMTGKVVQERADTPWHCSVASESYWSN